MPDRNGLFDVNDYCCFNNNKAAIRNPADFGEMAPDQDIKAPDKRHYENKIKEKIIASDKDDKTLSDLNDGELKGLLDEALTYKNPKDRVGKSKLFNNLLNVAEEDERNARAARAGGSELVRYCNPSAKRSSRHRKKHSISENRMHGGSLDNLAQAQQQETSKQRTKKSVSARQREGGSLPACNVSGQLQNYQFLDEARRKKAELIGLKAKELSLETECLLEHDDLAKDYQKRAQSPIEMIQFTNQGLMNRIEDDMGQGSVHLDLGAISRTISSSGAFAKAIIDEKKVDENGNALAQASSGQKSKKKKTPTDKNVLVCNAEKVPGHRSDIINDMEKLLSFIENNSNNNNNNNNTNKSNTPNNAPPPPTSSTSSKRSKSKKDHAKHSKLKKCNSLGEISTNLEEFDFNQTKIEHQKTKNEEKRAWEPTVIAYNSMENLDSGVEFRVVTKKKKSKKRRSSISGAQKSVQGNRPKMERKRNASAEKRRKSTSCSMPHSEKSADSSDADSVHSLPIDNQPISYADIAKNYEEKKYRNDQQPHHLVPKECILNNNYEDCGKMLPPDVHNIRNFPAIQKADNNLNKVGKYCRNGQNEVLDVGGEQYCNSSPPLPLDIPDVQTIEKIQLENHLKSSSLSSNISSSNNNNNTNNNNLNGVLVVGCDLISERTNSYHHNQHQPPPVVILSGGGNGKEVPGLVFGFDINEQLLLEDYDTFDCDDFIARFVAPNVAMSHNHDKIVNYIGAAWDDVIVNLINGSVKYYSD